MYIAVVTVHVKPEHVESFKAATVANAKSTRTEPGNRRFDVLQSVDDPTEFRLYEVYLSEGAFKAHQETEHYLVWKTSVADWMARPRTKIVCDNVFPTERLAW